MLTTTYIITLLACSHDLERCRVEEALPATFADRTACIAAIDSAMEDFRVDGPMMVAECQLLTSKNAHLVAKTPVKAASLNR